MKLKIWDRIVAALLGIAIVGVGIGMMLVLLNILPAAMILGKLEKIQRLAGWKQWAAAAVCVAVVLIGLRGVAILFRRRREKGFVLQRTELGDMSISMKALENMIRRCVSVHDEMKLNNVWISRVREGVTVDLKILLASGTNIPLVVNALQKQIKQYITSCSGIDVREVRVQVETDSVKRLPEPEAIATEAPAEEKDEGGKRRFWQHQEKPEAYVEPIGEAVAVSQPEPIHAAPVETVKAETEASAEATEKLKEEKRHFWQRKGKATPVDAAHIEPEQETVPPVNAELEQIAVCADPVDAPVDEMPVHPAEETVAEPEQVVEQPEEPEQPEGSAETTEPEKSAEPDEAEELFELDEEASELQRLFQEQQAADGEVEA